MLKMETQLQQLRLEAVNEKLPLLAKDVVSLFPKIFVDTSF